MFYQNHVDKFCHWRQLVGRSSIEISQTKTAISVSRVMLNICIYLTYLFKSNTIQHVQPIFKSQRQSKIRKSYYRVGEKTCNVPLLIFGLFYSFSGNPLFDFNNIPKTMKGRCRFFRPPCSKYRVSGKVSVATFRATLFV